MLDGSQSRHAGNLNYAHHSAALMQHCAVDSLDI